MTAPRLAPPYGRLSDTSNSSDESIWFTPASGPPSPSPASLPRLPRTNVFYAPADRRDRSRAGAWADVWSDDDDDDDSMPEMRARAETEIVPRGGARPGLRVRAISVLQEMVGREVGEVEVEGTPKVYEFVENRKERREIWGWRTLHRLGKKLGRLY